MKGFILIAIGFLLLHNTKSGDTCKVLLMESYFLEGMRGPLKEQNALCHTIQENCCTLNDIIKIHGDVSGTLEPALQSYREKMLRAIGDVVAFNGMIQKLKFTGASSPEQTNYCAKAEAEFREFNFELIADKLRNGFDKIYSESKDYHLAFYCSLCDYKAQLSIDTAKKTITVSPSTCMTRIINNKDYVTALNVDLINYFKAAQKFLDCVTYDNFYEFPFLFKEEGEFADVAKKCLDKTTTDSKFMPPDCNTFCGRMNYGGISPNLEGDAVFLDKITDYLRGMINARNRKLAKVRSSFKPFEHLDKFEIELQDPRARKLARSMLFPGRMLAEAPGAAKKKAGPPGPGAPIEEITQYYDEVYNEIAFEVNPKSTELLKLQSDPFNLSQFKVTFSTDEKALDITSYFNGLNFDVSKTELTKLNAIEKKKKVEIDPHIEALCMLADPKEIKLITDDLKLAAGFVTPPEFISEVEKALLAAKAVEKEADEIVDSAEAEEKKKKEEAAVEATSKPAEAPKTPGSRRLRKHHRQHNRRYRRMHRRHNNRRKYRRYRRTHKRRSNKHMSRRRKLEALMDFYMDEENKIRG